MPSIIGKQDVSGQCRHVLSDFVAKHVVCICLLMEMLQPNIVGHYFSLHLSTLHIAAFHMHADFTCAIELL